MRKVILALAIGAAVFIAVFILLPGRRASQPAPAASKSSLTQRDAGEGAVEIEVTLVVPNSPDAAKYGAETQTVFLVSMNTHSVDLSGYDLTQISELLAALAAFMLWPRGPVYADYVDGARPTLVFVWSDPTPHHPHG